jgi:hypothetical protein
MATENLSRTLSRTPKKGRKYFSLAEANRALPYVSRVVTDITACYRTAVELREHIEHPRPEDLTEKLQSDYDRSMDHLGHLMEELQLVGVELKDFESGLLDFPAIHEGREVYLCWHAGETHVQAWHEIDTGFAGRQDIATFHTGDR